MQPRNSMGNAVNTGEKRGGARTLFATLLPNQPRPMRIMQGPFRGAVVIMNPRNSMRKVLGIYERELNPWLQKALRRVTRVIDVGANDGYFTFGCAAAFRRLAKRGEILSFEPQQQHMDTLQNSLTKQPIGATKIRLLQALVGCEVGSGITTLDAICWNTGEPACRTGTLIKIDVEGAELEVLRGASSWLRRTNYFVIEVHEESLLECVERLFAAQGLRLNRVNQRPLPLIGREMRSERNWWLVSDLEELGRLA
jgi:hypothetical protein